MNIYELIRDCVLDLGYDIDVMSEISHVEDDMYEVLMDDVDILELMNNIRENSYYNKLVNDSGVDYITLIEKQYIEDKWVWVEYRFEEVDAGVNLIYSIISVPYISETGDYLNVESRDIADSLRREELVDLTG